MNAYDALAYGQHAHGGPARLPVNPAYRGHHRPEVLAERAALDEEAAPCAP